MSGSGMSSGSHPCAACKHHRRKCYPNCLLARYFPIERAQQFADVHRLYGDRNMLKFYNAVPPEFRDETVKSIIKESAVRRISPVYGSLGIIENLKREKEAAEKELETVRKQIESYKCLDQQQKKTVSEQVQGQTPPSGKALSLLPPNSPALMLDLNYSGEDGVTSSGQPAQVNREDVEPLDKAEGKKPSIKEPEMHFGAKV